MGFNMYYGLPIEFITEKIRIYKKKERKIIYK